MSELLFAGVLSIWWRVNNGVFDYEAPEEVPGKGRACSLCGSDLGRFARQPVMTSEV